MNNTPLLIIVLAGSLVVSCCSQRHVNSSDNGMEANLPSKNFEKMMVIDSRDIDGCGFLLMSADSSLFDPGTIDVQFQHNFMKVFVSYQIEKNRMNTCMRGKQIRIIEIKLQNQ